MLAALVEIGVRKFEERRQYIGVFDTLRRQMAVRIEFGGDQHLRPDHAAHPGQQIALAIVIALRDHRAMQAQDDTVDRQRGPQLGKDFVAQRLIGLALQQAARLGPGRGAFHHVEIVFGSALAQHDHRRGT